MDSQQAQTRNAGQSGVMALWDKLFTMLGVGSAQLLVSQEDLADEQTSHNLQVCVEAILSMGAVPILNENPASPSILEVRTACIVYPSHLYEFGMHAFCWPTLLAPLVTAQLR